MDSTPPGSGPGQDSGFGFALLAGDGSASTTASPYPSGNSPAERDASYFRAFIAGNYGYTSPPKLTFTYDRPPAAPTQLSPADGATNVTIPVTLTGTTASDPDGDPVSYRFRVFGSADATAAPLADSGLQTGPSWMVPPTTLRAGTTYWWDISAHDGTVFTASGLRRFTTSALADTSGTVSSGLLGLEPWWSTTAATATGVQGGLVVNPAGGNLVGQQLDATVVQGHGRVAYVLRRTYNSQAPAGISLPGSLGAGWQLGLAEDLNAVGGGALSGGALAVPPAGAGSSPTAVVLVDRDGTRHTFTPKPVPVAAQVPDLAITIDPSGVAQVVENCDPPKPCDPIAHPDRLTPASLIKALLATSAVTTPSSVCADYAYTAPAGVHAGLFRYVAVPTNGAGCGADPGTGRPRWCWATG